MKIKKIIKKINYEKTNIKLKDLEFIVSNKVTHIMNCAGMQITN